MHIIEKAVIERFPIGLKYYSPDLSAGETILTSTVSVLPVGLTLSVVTIAGAEVSAYISGGVAGLEYKVLFKVNTSGGKTFSNPNKDAIIVNVI